MFDSGLAAFALVVFVLTITPGADTMLVIRNTLRGGRRDGMMTASGVISGVFTHAVLSALGLSVILSRSAAAFHSVKLVGALYLVWLGIQSLRSARRPTGLAVIDASDDAPGSALPPRRRPFLEGLLTNILNPKVAIFYLAFLPQFIAPGDPVLAWSLLMALIHNMMGILWLGLIAVLVSRSRQWVRRPTVKRWLDAVSGTVLVALGIRLALEER